MSIWREFPYLKPCPFCGGEAELTMRRATWTVHCKECRSTGRSVEMGDAINPFPFDMILGSAEKAIALWNGRAKG